MTKRQSQSPDAVSQPAAKKRLSVALTPEGELNQGRLAGDSKQRVETLRTQARQQKKAREAKNLTR